MAREGETRVVFLRTGIVLGRDGGVAANMLFPFEFGLGGTSFFFSRY
jgi:NAD dependent epimerase/dehydratase family enzyme